MTLDDKIIRECSACQGKHKYCPMRDVVQYSDAVKKDFLEQLKAVELYRKELNKELSKELGTDADIGINKAYIEWVEAGHAARWRSNYESQTEGRRRKK